MLIRELMTPDPVCVDVHMSLEEAAEKLFELDVRHLPVLQEGELVGMLSDRDLKGHVFLFQSEDASENPSRVIRVGQVMSGSILSVEPESDVKDAIDIMIDNKVGAVLVVDSHNNTLSGIVTYVDILATAKEIL